MYIIFHNCLLLQRNCRGVFDHPVMICKDHPGLAASSLSKVIPKMYFYSLMPGVFDNCGYFCWCLKVIGLLFFVLFCFYFCFFGGGFRCGDRQELKHIPKKKKQEVTNRENKICHLHFSVNEERNGQSVDVQWFIRLDPLCCCIFHVNSLL